MGRWDEEKKIKVVTIPQSNFNRLLLIIGGTCGSIGVTLGYHLFSGVCF
jgi:hypothetical protein